MSFHATILTLYPQMFPGPLGVALAGKALERGLWSLDTVQIRDFASDKHRTVDDTPAGGGAGMVMKADILARAIDSVDRQQRPLLLMSPRGVPFTQSLAQHYATQNGLVILCGRFEGVDERIITQRNIQEVSLGDYILSGGEMAALTMLDSIVRLLPGVMGNAQSAHQESFESGLLEYPHYTRPQIFEGLPIPDVLTSGNHQAIAEWRQKKAEEITQIRRPDLWQNYQNNSKKP